MNLCLFNDIFTSDITKAEMSTTKIARALIGGNWKCNGTVAQVKSMIEVLNNAGPFSANSEVVIAAPSIHLHRLQESLRKDIAIASEVSIYLRILISPSGNDFFFSI